MQRALTDVFLRVEGCSFRFTVHRTQCILERSDVFGASRGVRGDPTIASLETSSCYLRGMMVEAGRIGDR